MNQLSFNKVRQTSLKVPASAPTVESYPNSLITPTAGFITTSILSTLVIIYILQPPSTKRVVRKTETHGSSRRSNLIHSKSTPLPGFGILGDRINEFIEIFLDALAIYVHK